MDEESSAGSRAGRHRRDEQPQRTFGQARDEEVEELERRRIGELQVIDGQKNRPGTGRQEQRLGEPLIESLAARPHVAGSFARREKVGGKWRQVGPTVFGFGEEAERGVRRAGGAGELGEGGGNLRGGPRRGILFGPRPKDGVLQDKERGWILERGGSRMEHAEPDAFALFDQGGEERRLSDSVGPFQQGEAPGPAPGVLPTPKDRVPDLYPADRRGRGRTGLHRLHYRRDRGI